MVMIIRMIAITIRSSMSEKPLRRLRFHINSLYLYYDDSQLVGVQAKKQEPECVIAFRLLFSYSGVVYLVVDRQHQRGGWNSVDGDDQRVRSVGQRGRNGDSDLERSRIAGR